MNQIDPPGRLRRPRRDSQAKATAMRAAAKSLFLRDGFDATSMDAIAQEANVSKRTVYTHFGSKEELFAGIIGEMCKSIVPIDASSDASGQNVEEQLTEIGVVFLRGVYSKAQVDLYRTIVSDARLYPDLGKMMYEGPVMASHDALRVVFERMVAQGRLDLPDCRLAAAQFIAMIKTDVHMRHMFSCGVKQDEDELRRTVASCVRLFLHGALVEPR